MAELDPRIKTAPVFEPLLAPRRYKGAYGGRGSGKSHFMAEHLVEEHIVNPGMNSLCVREVQKSLRESAKRLLEIKIQELGVGPYFEVQDKLIKTPGGGEISFAGMKDHTAESVKSFEGVGRCWIEEAQTISKKSWGMLYPTIRAPGSQIWASWNPRRAVDPIDSFFRKEAKDDSDVISVKADWSDNPWFPAEMEKDRLRDLTTKPDQYEHIWEGGYVTVTDGAYYAESLLRARHDGRICQIPIDPLLPVYSYHDIGGAGAKADAYTIWIMQRVGQHIHWLDYYEARGQVLSYHVNWMRSNGYEGAIIRLPHDGVNANNITGKRYADHWAEAGFNVPPPLDNQGPGAAMQRVEHARRLFPRMKFDEVKTEAGRQALGWYHPKLDEDRQIDLGPDHDWASHAADAFGLGATDYEEPKGVDDAPMYIEYGTMA